MGAVHIGRAHCKFLKCRCMCSVRAIVENITIVLHAAAQKNRHFKTCIVLVIGNMTNGENK